LDVLYILNRFLKPKFIPARHPIKQHGAFSLSASEQRVICRTFILALALIQAVSSERLFEIGPDSIKQGQLHSTNDHGLFLRAGNE
jgi:hypothetical protein